MPETTYFPRRLILAGAMISGVLLALAVHMLGARFGLDLGRLWRSDTREFVPAGAAGGGGLGAAGGFFRRRFPPTPHGRPGSGRNSRPVAPVLVPARLAPVAGGR